MDKPRISIIAAIQRANRGLGKGLDLLWKISPDLKRFKTLTSGHPIIMGRKTFDSIGRPLPNRLNIVITQDPNFNVEGCRKVSSLEEAFQIARETSDPEIFVIGGGQVYTQALPFVDRLYMTIIEGNKEADIIFPDYSEFTKVIEREDHQESDPPFSWVTLERP